MFFVGVGLLIARVQFVTRLGQLVAGVVVGLVRMRKCLPTRFGHDFSSLIIAQASAMPALDASRTRCKTESDDLRLNLAYEQERFQPEDRARHRTRRRTACAA